MLSLCSKLKVVFALLRGPRVNEGRYSKSECGHTCRQDAIRDNPQDDRSMDEYEACKRLSQWENMQFHEVSTGQSALQTVGKNPGHGQ